MDGVFTQSDECEGSKKDFSLWLEMTNMDRRWIFYHCDTAFQRQRKTREAPRQFAQLRIALENCVINRDLLIIELFNKPTLIQLLDKTRVNKIFRFVFINIRPRRRNVFVTGLHAFKVGVGRGHAMLGK